jgi:MFS transporter, DHA3 family, macrolide efflux protein
MEEREQSGVAVAERPDAAVPADAPLPRANFMTVLRHSGFRNLWLGQVVSQIGDYFAFLALMVVVSGFESEAAATTQAVSGLMIALTLPRLLFGVLAGVFVDRWDRRRTMLVSDVVRAGLSLGLIPAFQNHQLLVLYALAFALSTVGTLFNPAKGALIPRLVPADQLTAANALSQTSQMLAQFIGPALAGATFAAAGSGNQWVAFAVNAGSFLVSAVAILLIRVPRTQTAAHPSAGSADGSALRQVGQDLVVGLKALVLNRTIVILAVVFAVLNLGIGAINVLWIVFLRTQFGFTAADLAWRISVVDIAFAGGMVLASVLVGNFAAHVAPKWLIASGLIVAGAITTVMGALPSYWLVVAAMGLVGFWVGPINAGTTTLMQIVVPNRQLGRVGGGLGTVMDTALLVSMGMAGVAATFLGIPIVFLLAGICCAGSGALGWALLPPLTLRDKVPDDGPEAGPPADVPATPDPLAVA